MTKNYSENNILTEDNNDLKAEFQKENIEKIAGLCKKKTFCRHKKRVFGYVAKISIFASAIALVSYFIVKLISGRYRQPLTVFSLVSIVTCIWACFASESEMKMENKYAEKINFLEGAIDSADKF